ncbi:MAG: hypothetical protein AAF399_30535, partial [Bacteroidota bacterium]
MSQSESTSSKGDLISRHIFLFPFKWENKVDNELASEKNTSKKKRSGKKDSFSDKTDLEVFEKKLIRLDTELEHLPGYGWERHAFELAHLNHYNEFNYFYDYVREVLYDLEGPDPTNPGPL